MGERERLWTEKSARLGKKDGEGAEQRQGGVERGGRGQLPRRNLWVVTLDAK